MVRHDSLPVLSSHLLFVFVFPWVMFYDSLYCHPNWENSFFVGYSPASLSFLPISMWVFSNPLNVSVPLSLFLSIAIAEFALIKVINISEEKQIYSFSIQAFKESRRKRFFKPWVKSEERDVEGRQWNFSWVHRWRC